MILIEIPKIPGTSVMRLKMSQKKSTTTTSSNKGRYLNQKVKGHKHAAACLPAFQDLKVRTFVKKGTINKER